MLITFLNVSNGDGFFLCVLGRFTSDLLHIFCLLLFLFSLEHIVSIVFFATFTILGTASSTQCLQAKTE